MSSRRPRFKPFAAEQRRQVQAALDALRVGSYREDAPRIDVEATPKRERAPINTDLSEGPVLTEVGQILVAHPRTIRVERRNNGAAFNAKGAPVRFQIFLKGVQIVCDYEGLLIDGKPFAIECKRRDWKGPSINGISETAERERKQAARIAEARAAGGVGGFARSAEEARAILEGM